MPTQDEYQALLELSELTKPNVLERLDPVGPLFADSQRIALGNLRSAMTPAVQRTPDARAQAPVQQTPQAAVQPPVNPLPSSSQAVTAPAPAAPAPDPKTVMMQNLSNIMDTYGKQSQHMSEAEKSALATKYALVPPALERVAKAVTSPQPPVPQTLNEPPQPNIKPRPFLTAEGSQAIQTLVAGLGTLVTSLAGLRSPVAALNSLTGAMTGWAEGDAVRAERDWKQYESQVAKMQRENHKALELYELARVRRADDIEAAQATLQASLLGAELPEYAVQMGQKGLDRTANLWGMANQQLTQYVNQEHKVIGDMIRALTFRQLTEKRELDTELSRQKVEAGKESLSDSTLRSMAEQYLAGDLSVKQNVGRGVQGPKDLRRLNEMIYHVGKERGMTGPDIAAAVGEFQGFKAEQRSLGTRMAALTTASTVAESLIPAVKEASDNLPRTDIPLMNRALKAMNLGLDPDEELNAAQVKLAIAMNSLMYTYARALNPTGQARIGDLEHAREMLMDTWSKGAIDAGLHQIQIELAREREGLTKVRGEARETFKGHPPKIEIPKSPAKDGPLSLAEQQRLDELRQKHGKKP